jgi:hypothetical protein
MVRKYTEMKLSIVEQEIKSLESRLQSVEVNLRKKKEQRMELIGKLERMGETE